MIPGQRVHERTCVGGAAARRDQQLTETRSVMDDSIMAVVCTRYRHRDHLALNAAERPGPAH